MKYLLVLWLVAEGPSIEIINVPFDSEIACKNVGLALKIEYPRKILRYSCKGFPAILFGEEAETPDK